MLFEVNQLAHLILRPPSNADPQNEAWVELSRRVPCTFLVPAEERQTWLASPAGRSSRIIDWQPDCQPKALGNIRIALGQSGFSPCECVYVTWWNDDVAEAVNSRVGTILVGSTLSRCWPDLLVEDEPELVRVVSNVLDGKLCGYIGEVIPELRVRDSVSGAYALSPDIRVNLGGDDEGFVTVHAAGRYFATEDDRAQKHLLTQLILRAAKRGQDTELLSWALGYVVSSLDRQLNFDAIVGVPPKPSKGTWGLGKVIQEGCRIADSKKWGRGTLEQRYRQDLLRCMWDYPSQKAFSSFTERRANVRGAYKASNPWGARHVLLIDDVLTSGATVAECSAALMCAGIEKVSILVLGYNQKFARGSLHKLPCKKAGCSGHATLRFGGGSPFWGCTEFYNLGCTGKYKWLEGVRALNQLNRTDEIDDLVYADISF